MIRANVLKHLFGITTLFLTLCLSGTVSAQSQRHLAGWTGGAVDAGKVANPGSASTVVTVDGGYTLQAGFAMDKHTLTVSSTSLGGVVTPGKGSFAYDHGTLVPLLAAPWAQCRFTGWTGTAVDAGKVADPASADTTVTMDGDYTLQANFAVNGYTLTVSSSSWGSVTIPGEGPFVYERGTVVPIQAAAETQCRFTGWTGTAVDAGKVANPAVASTTVTMDGDYTLQATFAGEKYVLTVSATPWGSVAKPGQGAFAYDRGSLVAVSAVANDHYHFTRWTGTAVDAGKVTNSSFASTTVIVDADYTLQANFAADLHTLTISSASGGSVSAPGAGSFQYEYGSSVPVVATAQANHRFTGWTGTAVTAGKVADPASPSTTVKIDANYTLLANFESTTVRYFRESWETAKIGGYIPARESLLSADEGAWSLEDAVSQSSECGPTPQRAQIIALASGRALLLRSNNSGSACSDIVSVSITESGLTDPTVNLAIDANTILSFYEVGELDKPGPGSGSDCMTPPCFDNISLLLSDNRGNVLAYVLQRHPDARENVPNANVHNSYREIFLDPTAISYRRNLLSDFSTIPGFNPVGAEIESIEFRVAKHGTAVLDEITIGPALQVQTAPVYRFRSPVMKSDFFTASAAEKKVLMDVYPDVWTFEGIACFALPDDSEPNAVPVYRFWSPVTSSHVYTTREVEKDYLIKEYPWAWTFEGIAFYAFGEKTHPPQTAPVYRFWSPVLGSHFYATSEEEKDYLVENLPHIWILEGAIWYAYPASWDAAQAQEIIRNIREKSLR